VERAVRVSSEAEIWQTDPARMTFSPDRIDVWRVCFDCPELSERDGCELLAPDELARASRFHFEDDRRRFVKCRAALRILFRRYLATSGEGFTGALAWAGGGRAEIWLGRFC
jgi:hypothetical protein